MTVLAGGGVRLWPGYWMVLTSYGCIWESFS